MVKKLLLLFLLAGTASATPLTWNRASLCTGGEQDNILQFQLAQAGTIDGIFGCATNRLEPGKEYEFGAEITAPRSRMVYLQVKLFRDGKELRRIQSERNGASREKLKLVFNTGEADRIELLFRIPQSDGNIGRVVRAGSIYLGPPRPEEPAAKQELPRLEIAPGYRSCAVSLNNCQAADYPQIAGTLHYRPAGTGEWKAGPPPVLIRHENSLRACLTDLAEDRGYELKLTVNDNGASEEFLREFRTLGAELPVARTIVLSTQKTFEPESGTPDGYIRYTVEPGFVFNPGKGGEEAIRLDGAAYVILDGITLRGGKKHGVTIEGSHHIVIRNCDIAAYGRAGVFRPDLDGKFYDGKNAIWHDAGIVIRDSEHILIERNYIHDPDGFGNSWLYSHPAGPTGLYVGDSESVTVRYNDIIGSDLKRWNDGIDGVDNFSPNGGFRKNAEIYGNYFAFGDDDGMELDGGQQNARFFYNLVEGFYCGISLAPCLRGPSYVYRNSFRNPGDEFGFGGSGIKMISGVPARWGTVFLWDNKIDWSGGISWPPIPEMPGSPLFLLHARGNRFPEPVTPYPKHDASRFRIDIDDGGTAAGFLPPLQELPFRPAGFSVSRTQIRFEQNDDRIRTETVTVTATEPGFCSAFRIVSPEASEHFRVSPAEGILEYGKPLILTVSSAPDRIRQARRNAGAFSVRLADGFSRPVSVETDSRRHPELRQKAHAGAIYGEVVKLPAEELELRFEVSVPGAYFLFVRSAENSSSRTRAALDGGEPELRYLTTPLYTENPWRNVAEPMNKQRNLPYKLAAGSHTFRISRQPGMKAPDYTGCLLARDPNGFLYAP